MSKFIDLTGQRFGRLVVLERSESKNKRTFWKCMCDCGNICVVRGDQLKGNHTTSCGCVHKENTVKANFKDETGMQYGLLSVIRPLEEKGDKGITMWVCRCKCGNEIIVRGSSLRNGHTKSCGCYQRDTVSSISLKNEVGNRYGKLTVVEYVGI